MSPIKPPYNSLIRDLILHFDNSSIPIYPLLTSLDASSIKGKHLDILSKSQFKPAGQKYIIYLVP